MTRTAKTKTFRLALLAAALPLAAVLPLAGCATAPPPAAEPPVAVSALSSLQKVGEVDPRFLSYNVEMVEVTGGRFWRPYGSPGDDRYEYRPPLDLSDPRLRHLAAALAPAYVRISGTWANATWFADAETAPAKPPAGFDSVLTRAQWRGAVDFAKATGSAIVTSFATSPGARDAQGVWQSDTAARWLAYTREIGGSIAAAEFANEPNMISLTQPPEGYTPADYRRDYTRFANWLEQTAPDTLLVAPGYAELGEPTRTLSRRNQTVRQFEPETLITPELPRLDVFSFHFYGGGSERCGGAAMHSVEKALSPAWLAQVDPALARVKALRAQVAPGAPLWNTETGETACGGNPWASTFADSFRFIDTLGRSARQGVRVIMHNTLAASDYALLDEHHGYATRPNYWAAVLWKRTMGTNVLAAPEAPSPDVQIYAHCLVGGQGGVGLAAINLGTAAHSLTLGAPALTWTMTGQPIDTKDVRINGNAPRLDADGTLSGLAGRPSGSDVAVPGRSIVFVAVTGAANPACR